MKLEDAKKRLESLKKKRIKRTNEHRHEIEDIDAEIKKIRATITLSDRDSIYTRLVKAQPFVAVDDIATPESIRLQINRLIDGDVRSVAHIRVDEFVYTNEEMRDDVILFLENTLITENV